LAGTSPTAAPVRTPDPADTRVLYLVHFGLAEAPFSLTPDPRYLYMSERHREALAHLLYGVREGGSIVQLTGEVGTGKTTLCRCLLEQLPPEVDVALILNPRLTGVELLATVCDELRIAYPRGTTSLKVLVDALYEHLLAAHARGRRTVLIIDEAQNLPAEVLEQIRLLTNLETAQEKLLQIILIGQPELISLLNRQKLRQLAQRVTARYHLLPFSRQDTLACIRHRLSVAGQRRSIFTRAAMRRVHRGSGGIPRLINVIADRALLGAYAHDRQDVDAATVRQAAREILGRPRSRALRPRFLMPTLGGFALMVLAAGFLLDPDRLTGPMSVARRVAGDRALSVGESARAARPAPADPAPQRPLAEPVSTRTVPAAHVPGAAETRPVASGRVSSAEPRTLAAGEEPAPVPLADLLADPGLRSDRTTAFARLYARWGLEHPGGGGCELERLKGLACLHRTGTWKKLRRFDLPAILELTAASGARHSATLAALDDTSATLEFGERRVRLPLADIDAVWDGVFILLWKPPAVTAIPLRPGARGQDVVWLRQRLSDLDGTPEPRDTRDLFDDELRLRVIAFQRSQALVPDGVVAEETLTRLTRALEDTRIPSLSRPTP
jgi:general secretion pathway protein A